MKKAFIAASMLLASPTLGEDRPRARVYEAESNKQKLLFNYYREETLPQGNLHVKARFVDPQGHEAFREELECEGLTPRKYSYQHGQIDESASIEVREGKIHFIYTKDGKQKSSSERVPEELVVGPTIFPYLKAHISELLKGTKIKFRLAVLDRRETYGFQFSNEGEIEREGRKLWHISMKPTSLLVSAFVDPIGFYASSDGRVFESYGSTLLRKKVGEKWEQLSADILWD